MSGSGRRGITLIECLVSLVAGSVILGGFLALFTTADLAARSNSSDVESSAADYNLDRVLGEIAACTTGLGATPTRLHFPNIGPEPDAAGNENKVLVYERMRDIRSTAYWSAAQGGPIGANQPPPNTVNPKHPFPLFYHPGTGVVDQYTNIDVNAGIGGYSQNWLTGIVGLYRRDRDPNTGRYRTAILWQAELPMNIMVGYGLPMSFVQNGSPGANAAPTCLTIPQVQALADNENPHLMFEGTRVLGVGIQTFDVVANADQMTWRVTR